MVFRLVVVVAPVGESVAADEGWHCGPDAGCAPLLAKGGWKVSAFDLSVPDGSSGGLSRARGTQGVPRETFEQKWP